MFFVENRKFLSEENSQLLQEKFRLILQNNPNCWKIFF